MPRNSLLSVVIRALLCALVPGACLASRSGYERASATADKTAAYRENLLSLRDQVGLTVASLRTLTENPSDSPRSNGETFQTFQRELANLVDLARHSRRTYGRMDARAELFFGRWVEDTSQIQNGDLKKSSESRRAALQANYDKLAQGQIEVDQALQHFAAGLTDLGFYLEHDLTAAGLASAQGPLASAFAEGAKLQEALSQLAHTTDEARVSLTPLQAQAPSQEARAVQEGQVR